MLDFILMLYPIHFGVPMPKVHMVCADTNRTTGEKGSIRHGNAIRKHLAATTYPFDGTKNTRKSLSTFAIN